MIQFYFFIFVLLIGVSFQIFLNKKRKDKVLRFNEKISEFTQNITSKTTHIVNKLEDVESKVKKIEHANRTQTAKNNRPSIVSETPHLIRHDDFKRLPSDWHKVDERLVYKVQRTQTYYHQPTQSFLELVHPQEVLGIGRYVQITALRKILDLYQIDRPEKKEEELKAAKMQPATKDYLTVVKR
jgi:hypothetical protein